MDRTVKYRKHLGKVTLSGMLKNGELNKPMFLLPTGYRPAATHNFAISSNNAYGNLVVMNNGSIFCNIGSNDWVSLSGVEFYIG